ncbi:Nif3-like dinuclear metal center hexameric protein [Desulfobulbus elongatus]|uniref:Nif3-like dinuclear metal center hexameric protein n=1 Tax=Desulfobulbus elongatus TaxID=53332 RepID=UPI00047F466A|nr:Nif3-like dinuclear metal center hexameric protein [Desulfobulbus elongatus]
MPTVRDVLTILQQITPESLAEEWDNVGLLVGDPHQHVQRVLLALDPTSSLIDQAAAEHYDLVVTHHPVIFRPLKTIRTDTPTGRFIATAARHRISVIACHTNLDSIQGGVSDHLAQSLDLADTRPLVPSRRGCDLDCGLGRIGTLPAPVTADVFLDRIRQACSPPWVLEAGTRPERVTVAAVCGGSCSDLAEIAHAQGADVFVTAEVKHAVARWAADAGLWLLDAGHFATEQPAMRAFRDMLRRQTAARSWNLAIDAAVQQPPLNLA